MLDNLMAYCMQSGLNMITMRNSPDRISITIEDNGSGAYRVLESYVALQYEMNKAK